MNIAMFTDAYFPRINGVSISVQSYAAELTKLGHSVCIVCCNYEKASPGNEYRKYYYETDAKNSEIKVLRIPTIGVFFSDEDRAARLDQWHTIKKQMDSFNPDVVHLNSEFTIGYFGLIYARHRKIPLVYTFHTLWEDYVEGYIHFLPIRASKKIARELIRFYLKRADEIICPTKRIVDVVKEYNVNNNTDILPTGIPEDICEVKKGQKKLFLFQLHNLFPVVRKKHILLYVGRVVKEKNLDFLFPVLFTVKKVIPDTILMIVGGGPELNELKLKAKSLHCVNDICFTGYQSRDNLAYFYSMADVFVFPSCTETQGLVTVEAMLAGLPVVAIGEMGTVDVMQGNNGGFMVNNDVNEFYEKVIKLHKDKKLNSQKQTQTKECAKKWSISTLTPKLIEYYEKAIETHERRN